MDNYLYLKCIYHFFSIFTQKFSTDMNKIWAVLPQSLQDVEKILLKLSILILKHEGSCK